MNTKKTEKASLENKRLLFVEIGCIVALSAVYFGFEYTTEETRTVMLEDTPCKFRIYNHIARVSFVRFERGKKRILKWSFDE